MVTPPALELVDMAEDVVVFNCLMEIVEEMDVTTEVDVDTVTVWDSETMDFEDVMLKLKFFFFLLILDSSVGGDLPPVVVVVVVVVVDVVVVRTVVVDVLSELNLIASNQEMSLPLLFE